mmetsp:Transcript_15543/g.33663  ORF Transcript_15543/g.33663 Transcript_15543/m.33663 type:complete len:89 (+) Transcript_15543:4011-4277(+)
MELQTNNCAVPTLDKLCFQMNSRSDFHLDFQRCASGQLLQLNFPHSDQSTLSAIYLWLSAITRAALADSIRAAWIRAKTNSREQNDLY